MIVPVYKKIGESTHLLAKKVGDKNYEKATHTGTLDPMAEGVVIVLTGEDRFKKSNYSDWKKTYQFEIMFGVNTDSLDLLGLSTSNIDSTNSEKISKDYLDEITNNIKNIIPKFIGEQFQSQPLFSAKRIDGESHFDKAKAGEEISPVENRINIYSIKILKQENVPLEKLEKEIVRKISLVKGDFRQKEIIENWRETFTTLLKLGVGTLPIIKLETKVGKRTYVRALTKDLAEQIKLPATTFSIVRTQNGEYKINDCSTSLI